MAVVTVPYQPALTAEAAMTIFAGHLGGQYEVRKTRLFKRDFTVKKNWSTAVSVGLRQEPGATKFIVTGCQPFVLLGVAEFLAGMLLVEVIAISLFGVVLAGGILFWVVGGCLGLAVDWIMFGSGRKALESEIRAFVENAGDLGAPESPSRPVPGVILPAAQIRAQPVLCASCSTPLAGQAQFCHACGTPASIPEPEHRSSCTACGAPLGEDARFCQTCGAAIPVLASTPETPTAVSSVVEERDHCIECGTELPKTSLYCHGCGASVASTRGSAGTTSTLALAPEDPSRSGYCAVCGQDLGVNEKLRGVSVHERCAVPTPKAIAAPPVSELPEARPEAIASPIPAPAPGPKTPGRCDLCGEELGVNEKLRGLATHEKCPVLVTEAQPSSPAQAGQVYCTECGIPMPASSRFCHKCGSAAAAAVG